MNKEGWEKIINHQVKIQLQERGLREIDITARELCKYRFEMALKLLEELG